VVLGVSQHLPRRIDKTGTGLDQPMVDATELPIKTGVDAMELADAMFGPSIKIVSATFKGDPQSAGIYSDGLKTAPGVTPSDSGVILSTGKVEDFTNSSGQSNQTASRSTDTTGVDGDADLDKITGAQTFDGAIFESDFIPEGSVLTMQITFSSEEYLEYVGSGFNDAVGVWVNGVKAELTVGDGDVSINNINPGSNGSLYVDNAKDQFNTEMDGFTVTLTLKAPVKPGEVNSIKIGIADGGDAVYDSNLLIAGDSVQTAVVASDDSFTVMQGGSTTIDLLGNDVNAGGGKLTITEINGVPVQAGDTVLLSSGLEVTVNANGTITIVGGYDDPLGEANFSYEVENETGITDVGFVTGDVLPCFVEGVRIDTARGPVPVEKIAVGDLVLTLDDGFQPVRWRGARSVVAVGALAPVRIPAGTFGAHGEVAVSPQHRICLTGWRAELYCGAGEVLVRAAHLVRAGRLRQDSSVPVVTYHHLLFDRHQIIRSAALRSG
jgi:Hint domain/Bacterial cadherin-like domain